MSDLIRTVAAKILPMPGGSRDTYAKATRDFYSQINRISEREQAAEERNVARLVRAARDATRPTGYSPPVREMRTGLTQVYGTINTIGR
jgi:hypothetical protein